MSKKSKEGYLQCAVETYGGGIWHTWFDRDLSLAGRVIVETDAARFESRLVHIRRPLLRVPSLAIHLDRSVNDAFRFSQEDHLQPILGLADALNQPAPASSDAVDEPTMASKHHPVLLELLAQELHVRADQIQDFELSLFDTQPPVPGGVANEFLFTPRVDNQMTCFCATEALINAVVDLDTMDSAKSIRAIALFDNEEVGSVSHHGAESDLLWSMVHRLAGLQVPGASAPRAAPHELVEQSLARSFLISSDTAHGTCAVSRSRAPKLRVDPRGAPASGTRPPLTQKLNHGPVIKTNAKQRYASTAVTTFLLRRVAKRAGVPLQEFEVRNDCPCGSTIGPMLSKVRRRLTPAHPHGRHGQPAAEHALDSRGVWHARRRLQDPPGTWPADPVHRVFPQLRRDRRRAPRRLGLGRVRRRPRRRRSVDRGHRVGPLPHLHVGLAEEQHLLAHFVHQQVLHLVPRPRRGARVHLRAPNAVVAHRAGRRLERHVGKQAVRGTDRRVALGLRVWVSRATYRDPCPAPATQS